MPQRRLTGRAEGFPSERALKSLHDLPDATYTFVSFGAVQDLRFFEVTRNEPSLAEAIRETCAQMRAADLHVTHFDVPEGDADRDLFETANQLLATRGMLDRLAQRRLPETVSTLARLVDLSAGTASVVARLSNQLENARHRADEAEDAADAAQRLIAELVRRRSAVIELCEKANVVQKGPCRCSGEHDDDGLTAMLCFEAQAWDLDPRWVTRYLQD